MTKTPHDHFFEDEDEDEDEDLEDLEEEPGRADSRGLSDLLRKAVTGVGAVMTNDEGVRDYKLTNNAMRMISGTAEKTKREVTEVVTKEVRNFLDHLELHEIITKVMTGMTFEINTQIKIVPNEEGKNEVELVKKSFQVKKETDDSPEADQEE